MHSTVFVIFLQLNSTWMQKNTGITAIMSQSAKLLLADGGTNSKTLGYMKVKEDTLH